MWRLIRILLGWMIFSFLTLAAIIYAPGGFSNLQFFVNFEALLVVVGGTFLWGWMSWGFKDLFLSLLIGMKGRKDSIRSPNDIPSVDKAVTVLSGLKNVALSMGVFGTLLGMILMLGCIDDVAQIPRKMAIALTAAFFGIFLSEIVFGSLVAKLTKAGDSVSSQKGMIYSFLFLALLSFFVILYALGAPLNRNLISWDLPIPEIRREIGITEKVSFDPIKKELTTDHYRLVEKIVEIAKEQKQIVLVGYSNAPDRRNDEKIFAEKIYKELQNRVSKEKLKLVEETEFRRKKSLRKTVWEQPYGVFLHILPEEECREIFQSTKKQ